jgi:argininosuccinate synthase
MSEKVVLAYSGGLDTSVAIRWLTEKYGFDVIALTVDLGSEKNLDEIVQRARSIGAIKAIAYDARKEFVDHFVIPSLRAGAMYEGEYPLATALGRPLIAWVLVNVARREGASAIAHGSTGKGNDQVRFDVSTHALAPELKVIAPVREWGMTRDDEIEYAKQNNIPIPVTVQAPYSTDVNLWGRSIEAGKLEDPWVSPPEECFEWTQSVAEAPQEPEHLEIEFEQGVPVSLNGKQMSGIELIGELNRVAGEHGVGRIDHVENRLVGIKSREVYESPAAITLHNAHSALESLTLSKEQQRFKQIVAQHIADLIYNGLWFSGLHENLRAFVESTQRFVTGAVRTRLHKGACTVEGRRSPFSLYRHELATYDRGDQFDHNAAVGFIQLWGLPLATQAQAQMLRGKDPQSLMPPEPELDA